MNIKKDLKMLISKNTGSNNTKKFDHSHEDLISSKSIANNKANERILKKKDEPRHSICNLKIIKE